MRFVIIFFLIGQALPAQTLKLFTFTNDSLFLNESKKIILIYYTDRACFDCFVHIHNYIKSDTSVNYYFTIEKSNSAMSNYDIYTKLVNNGVPKERVLFTKIQTHDISPFFKIYNKGSLLVIPYSEVFEDKTTLELSQKLKKEIKGG